VAFLRSLLGSGSGVRLLACDALEGLSHALVVAPQRLLIELLRQASDPGGVAGLDVPDQLAQEVLQAKSFLRVRFLPFLISGLERHRWLHSFGGHGDLSCWTVH